MYCPLKDTECYKCPYQNNCVLLTAEIKAIEASNKIDDLERQIKELKEMIWQITP